MKRVLRNLGVLVRDVAIVVVAALAVSFLIKTFVVRSFHIPTSSMENTLAIDDRVIVNQLTPGVFPLERGDIVVFADPGGWLPSGLAAEDDPLTKLFDWVGGWFGVPPSSSEQHLIKRVIGLPGDRVACCDALGAMTVNGVPLDEPYLTLPEGTTLVSGTPFDVEVPEGTLWVMGDNRYNSADSRANRDKPSEGFVPISLVVGRAIVISWPVERWTWLDNYPSTFLGVDP